MSCLFDVFDIKLHLFPSLRKQIKKSKIFDIVLAFLDEVALRSHHIANFQLQRSLIAILYVRQINISLKDKCKDNIKN